MTARGFDPDRDETGEKFVEYHVGEPDTVDDEMARDDAPEPEWDDDDDG